MPAAPAAVEDSKDAVKGSYVGIHSTGFACVVISSPLSDRAATSC